MGETWSKTSRQGGKELRIVVISTIRNGTLSYVSSRVTLAEITTEFKPKLAKIYKTFAWIDETGLGARTAARALHRHMESDSDGLIFLVDGDCKYSKIDALRRIYLCLEKVKSEDIPFLVIVAKQDQDGRDEHVSDLAEALRLTDTTKVPWKIVVTDTGMSESISEGLEWLHDALAPRKKGPEAIQRIHELVKSGKATLTGNHSATFVQKMMHIVSPSPKPA